MMNANGEQIHQTLAKLVNRVQNDSRDSLQTFENLLNILKCLDHLKEPVSLLGSDSLLNECIHDSSNHDLNSDSNSELNNELNSESTNETDSGQQSSEEGSTNDLKSSRNTSNHKNASLLELILQLLSIIVNHLTKQVHSKQDAELLINHWKHCSCFKHQQKNCLNKTTDQCNSTNQSNDLTNPTTNLLINTNHHHQTCSSLFISSSGIQSDASCSPLSSLTTDCCCANLSTCSLSPSCCFSTTTTTIGQQKQSNKNHKCSNKDQLNKSLETTTNESTNKTTVINSIPNPPPPIPPPPPMPNLNHHQINQLDKSMSNSSLNNQLTNSFNSNLSSNTPPQSINEVPVILLETPKPRAKMKTLNWNKISVHKVLTSHKPNIWSKLFSKKDDKKEKKTKSKKSKNSQKEIKKKENDLKFSSDEETSLIEDDCIKNQRRNAFLNTSSSKQRINQKQLENSSSSNNLTKLSSTITTSNSSINSTSTASKSKKQSEEDLMNIVKLDFDTLEGLFCQPNNQVNIGVNNVDTIGTMIANFSTTNASNSVPNSCPNSPSTNRRNLNQPMNNHPYHQILANNNNNKQSNSSVYGNQLNGCFSQLNSSNQFSNHHLQQSTNQSNSNLSNLNLTNQPTNSTKLNSYLINLNCSSQSNVGQLTKLNNKSELINGHDSVSTNYLFDERKQTTLKRCSGEFNPNVDYIHNLLDSKRSLNINIFLKQFRSVCSNDGDQIKIIRLIKLGDHNAFGAEKLLHLIKLLPDQTEIDLLKAHSDDQSRLPVAERFLIQLMSIPK